MIVRLTSGKVANIQQMCAAMKRISATAIQNLAVLIGKLCASFPSEEYGMLHYRALERLKCAGLRLHKGNYMGQVQISQDARNDLDWRIDHLTGSFKSISHGRPSVTIETDASETGWGATLSIPTGGRWDLEEA